MKSKILSSGSLSRLQLLTVPLALTLTLIGGIGWYVWDSYQAFKRIQTQDMRIQQLSAEITYLDEVLTMSAHMAVATGDSQWIERYQKYDPQVIAALAEATKLIPTVFEGKASEQINASAQKLLAMEEEAFQLVQRGQRQLASELLFGQEYETQKQIYTAAMGQVTSAMQQYAENSLKTQTQKASIAILIVIATLIILILVWIFVLRMLVNSIQSIREVSSTISAVTNQITSAIQEQEELAVEQASAVSQTTATMNELGSSARQSAEQVEVALIEAKQALNLADNGTQVVSQTLNSMDTLKNKVGAIADRISCLSEQTRQIGTISSLARDLANQTNMLSLNAAVEAVRAGEAGRGFSVVASEIRKLADQSKGSAQKIANLVNDIQLAITSTAMVTDEGTKTVSEGMNLTHRSAQTFNNVADAVNTITLNSQQISLTAQQQAVAIQQVFEAMNSLNLGASRTTNVISQTKTAAQQLNEAASSLKELV